MTDIPIRRSKTKANITNKRKANFATKLLDSKKSAVPKVFVFVENELKALQKIKNSTTSPEVTTRMKYVITSVDGNPDRKYINDFVDTELTSRDSIELRKRIREHTPDVDNNFNFVCGQCGHEERVAVPMTVTFFWPEAGR